MCQTIFKSFNRYMFCRLKSNLVLWSISYLVLKQTIHRNSKDMTLLKPFLFSLFVILIYTNDRYHNKYSFKGEETIRRFAREANLKVENIKEKRFDRIYVYQNPDNIIQEATKLR